MCHTGHTADLRHRPLALGKPPNEAECSRRRRIHLANLSTDLDRPNHSYRRDDVGHRHHSLPRLTGLLSAKTRASPILLRLDRPSENHSRKPPFPTSSIPRSSH